jgi:hypothetical protein
VKGQRESFRRYVDIAADLAQTPVSADQQERFIIEFIPVPPEALVSDRVMKNVETARQQIRAILAGPTCEGISGTAFGLLQASGEYLDHYRKTRKEGSLVARQLLSTNRMKVAATSLVREVVKSGA